MEGKKLDALLTQACLASARAYDVRRASEEGGADAADDSGVQYFSDPVTDAQAIIILYAKAEKPIAIVAFRGSTSTSDWFGNALVPMIRVPGHGRRVRAHVGFVRQYVSLHAPIRAALERMDVSSVLFCGHSLGGALACVACSMWDEEGHGAAPPPPCGLATFGAPRPGNAAFAAIVRAKTSGNITRVVHDLDVVPSVPMRAMMYCHVEAPWVAIDHQGHAHAEPEERSFREELILRIWGVLSADFGVSDHFMSCYLRACGHPPSAEPSKQQESEATETIETKEEGPTVDVGSEPAKSEPASNPAKQDTEASDEPATGQDDSADEPATTDQSQGEPSEPAEAGDQPRARATRAVRGRRPTAVAPVASTVAKP